MYHSRSLARSLVLSLSFSLSHTLFLSLFVFLSLSRIHSNLTLTFAHALASLSCPFARRSSFLILTKLFTRSFAAALILSASSSLLSETPYLPPTRSGYINYLFITLHYILVFPLMQRRFPIWLAPFGLLPRQRTWGYGKVPRRVSVFETLSFRFFFLLFLNTFYKTRIPAVSLKEWREIAPFRAVLKVESSREADFSGMGIDYTSKRREGWIRETRNVDFSLFHLRSFYFLG